MVFIQYFSKKNKINDNNKSGKIFNIFIGIRYHKCCNIKLHNDDGHYMRKVDASTTDLLLLPGGDIWEQGGNQEIAPLVKAISDAQKTIAAICGATVFMANNGYLDSIEHTSNALPYLQKLAPNYKGEKLYQNKPCVTSGNIITANGAAMIEFAIAIFNKFNVEEPDFIEKISALYKSGGMDYRF